MSKNLILVQDGLHAHVIRNAMVSPDVNTIGYRDKDQLNRNLETSTGTLVEEWEKNLDFFEIK